MLRRAMPVLVILIALLSVGGWLFLKKRRSPEYALTQIQRSIADHNRLAFEQQVDVDALSTEIVEGVMTQIMHGLNSDGAGGALGSGLAITMLENMKPGLITALKNTVVTAVETGGLDSILHKKERSDSLSEKAFNLLARAGLSESYVEGVGEIKREEALASIPLRIRQPMLDTTLSLRFRMKEERGKWRLVGIENLPAYLDLLDGLQAVKLAAARTALFARLAKIVSYGTTNRRKYELAYQDYLNVETPVKNVGSDTLSMIVLSYTLKGKELDLDEAAGLLTVDLAPGESGTASWLLQYNQFIDWHSDLAYGEVTVAPKYLVLRRGAITDTVLVWKTFSEYQGDKDREHRIMGTLDRSTL